MTHSLAVLRQPALAGHTIAFDTWAADAISRAEAGLNLLPPTPG